MTQQTTRRDQVRFPFRTRWLLVQARWSLITWRECWQDVVYLIRG